MNEHSKSVNLALKGSYGHFQSMIQSDLLPFFWCSTLKEFSSKKAEDFQAVLIDFSFFGGEGWIKTVNSLHMLSHVKSMYGLLQREVQIILLVAKQCKQTNI